MTRASSPTPAHSRKGRPSAWLNRTRVDRPVDEEGLRVGEVERNAELDGEHVGGAGREHAEGNVRADEPAGRLRNRAVAPADRDEIEAARQE